jgi:predicted flap endonuclease-1-like 5' DNA nuclease
VVAAAPVIEPAADTAPAVPDDLEAITGIGPVYAGRLHGAGIQTFAQLAELSPDQIREIIGPIRSGHMIEPEKWIAEARRLATVGR